MKEGSVAYKGHDGTFLLMGVNKKSIKAIEEIIKKDLQKGEKD